MMWASLFLAGILSGWWWAFALAVAPPANPLTVLPASTTDLSKKSLENHQIFSSQKMFLMTKTFLSASTKNSYEIGKQTSLPIFAASVNHLQTEAAKSSSDEKIESERKRSLTDFSKSIGKQRDQQIFAASAASLNHLASDAAKSLSNPKIASVTDFPSTDLSKSIGKQTEQPIFAASAASLNHLASDAANLLSNPKIDSVIDFLSTDPSKSTAGPTELPIFSRSSIHLASDAAKSSQIDRSIVSRQSFGPLLQNFESYQVTPLSLRETETDLENRIYGSISSRSDPEDEADHFEDLSELQDYSLDDEEWSRDSRIYEIGKDSIYPPLDLSMTSSSSSASSIWTEIGPFGPAIDGSIDRPRVSRSAKQQRGKNRTRSESAREQRRKCRNKGCRGRNWCPDMDVGNRAFLAPTVFEGKARSMSSLRKPGSNYAVTFEVKQVYKSQSGYQPLQKNDSVRLHFRDKASNGKSTLCNNFKDYSGQDSNDSGGVVRANIKRGKVYLVFVNRVGPRNFTILGEPVIRSKKNEQAVQAVVRPDYVREVTLSELRDSVARLRDRVKLVCRTRGSPPPRVHWLKDGVPLHPRRGLRIQHKRRRSKVVISSARQEDSGRYECVAESTSGHRASLAAQLLVAHDTRIQDTTTAAWPRQEQPCPIAGDFCMNGGTCLFFETVGEPACRCAEGFTGLRCETKDVISTGSVYNRHRAPFSCKLGLSTSYYC